MVQFLSIIFFSSISSISLGFLKVPVFLCHPIFVHARNQTRTPTFQTVGYSLNRLHYPSSSPVLKFHWLHSGLFNDTFHVSTYITYRWITPLLVTNELCTRSWPNEALSRLVCLFLTQQPPVGQGLLLHEVSRSHTKAHLWTSDQLVAETSTWQHKTLATNIHAPGGIRTHNLSSRAAADLRLKRCGNWDRLTRLCLEEIIKLTKTCKVSLSGADFLQPIGLKLIFD